MDASLAKWGHFRGPLMSLLVSKVKGWMQHNTEWALPSGCHGKTHLSDHGGKGSSLLSGERHKLPAHICLLCIAPLSLNHLLSKEIKAQWNLWKWTRECLAKKERKKKDKERKKEASISCQLLCPLWAVFQSFQSIQGRSPSTGFRGWMRGNSQEKMAEAVRLTHSSLCLTYWMHISQSFDGTSEHKKKKCNPTTTNTGLPMKSQGTGSLRHWNRSFLFVKQLLMFVSICTSQVSDNLREFDLNVCDRLNLKSVYIILNHSVLQSKGRMSELTCTNRLAFGQLLGSYLASWLVATMKLS